MAEHHHLHKKTTTELPPDMLYYNILPRLPAKSLHRFKYVSKQWHSFITSLEFLNLPLYQQHHHKLLLLSTTTPTNLYTIDCESPENSLTPTCPFPCKKATPQNITIITSCNGLVCLGITKCKDDDEYSYLMLWNPATGEYKKLSELGSYKECYEVTARAYGLYYRKSDDDYKLLVVTHHHYVCIYSLRANSWRKLDSEEDLISISYVVSESWGESIVQNEKLFFLKKGKRRTIGKMSYSIIRFDTNMEEFEVVATPRFGVRRTANCLRFTLLEKDGRVHLCLIYKANGTDLGVKLWKLDEDGDGEWTKVVSRLMLPSLYCFQEPVYLMSDGNWLTYCLHSGCHVYKLDLVRNLSEMSFSNTDDSVDITPRGRYIETVVSPNR